MSQLPSRHSTDVPSGQQSDSNDQSTPTSIDNNHPSTHEKPIEQLNHPPSEPHPAAIRQQSHRDSMHEDLFLDHNTVDHVVYSKETTISASADNENDMFIKASWQLKVIILLCMLALPVGCHYLEATVGTLKTALKSVSMEFKRETAVMSAPFCLLSNFPKCLGHTYTHTYTLCSL